MKPWEQINEKIESGKAVVLTAEEIIDYVDRKGLTKAAEEVDVVTTATFGPMCSSGCFLNFGHSIPRIRITEAGIDDVPVYSGVAAVDVYLGATELRQDDPKNLYHPGEFRFGGAHVMEKLVAGEELQLFALSYGTDDYPLKELRTYFTIHDLNQAIMVNPRNCYQNYNVAVNSSDKPIYSYLGLLKPEMGNIGYSSAGQLSPLLNDPLYLTIGVGTTVWLAGAKGMVFSEGTQHAPTCIRGQNDVPMEGAGTLALTGNMKEMRKEYVRGVSLPGYGVSLALGIGIPIPILNERILKYTTVRDEEIMAGIIDYSHDYQYKTGKIVARVSYAELKSGEVVIDGKKIPTGSLSSYAKAREIAGLLADEIRRGDFLLSRPIRPLPSNQTCRGLAVKERSK
jgi:uncharacterized protein (DUF39 family)